MQFTIMGQGTALPEHAIGVEEALQYAEAFAGGDEDEVRRLRLVYRKCGVEKRHITLLDGHSESGPRQEFFQLPNGHRRLGPRVAARMRRYETDALPLALRASREALAQAEVAPEQITHLVTVSCSGFAAPGVDIGLVTQLGLPHRVERTHVGFMGCHGALNGLRVARAIGESNPGARVLLCAVELCSLHYAVKGEPDQLVANALFADGAAAVVGGPCESSEAAQWRIGGTGSCLIPDSQEDMSWRIGDHGFIMTLSRRVPNLIRTHLAEFVEEWLDDHGLRTRDIATWAVHPGGPRILDGVESALSLPKNALEVSRDVLRACGNMSSPTLLFILRRLREADAPRPCVALGFGPGLMAEATLFT
jgi:predicted naringenin-chalcone synthase